MRVVVHIGTGKAGSSSIQHWLQTNQQPLTQAGIYPSRAFVGFERRKLAIYASDLDPRETSFGLFEITTPEAHDRLRQEVARSLQREIADARERGCHSYVLSSEFLSNRLQTDTTVERLRALLADCAEEVQILCFMRPQVDLLASRLSTQARMGRINPLLVHCPRTHPMVDYLGLYRRWDRAFPGSVKLVPYKRSPSVIADLCDVLGANPSDYRAIQSRNARIDYRSARISHNVNLSDRVSNIQEGYLNLFMEDLPCERPLTISRLTAMFVHCKYVWRNRKLARVSGNQIQASDLRPRFAAYPLTGTVLRAALPFDGAPMLRRIFIKFDVQLCMERARWRTAEAELAALRGEHAKAGTHLRQARAFLDKARTAPHGVPAQQLDSVAARLDRIGNSELKDAG